MITLSTLGPLELRDSAGGEILPVLRQPKRLALLAYLALASPRRFHRRDSLVALFWPGLDQEHARAALRRAVYFLRQALGDDVIVSRGDEELGLAEGTLRCDATGFERALAAGRLEEALTLYRGDLLEGFFVAGAPEAERWLDGERGRLRALAGKAAWVLADRSGSDTSVAVEWATRAVALAPDDEAALRRLLALLDRSGDRAGALRAYGEFVARMEGEYQLEPSSETRAFADRLRLPLPAPPPTAVSAPAAAPLLVAVLPFDIRGAAAYAYLGEGMVDLLSVKLDGAGELRAADSRAVLHAAASAPADSADWGRRVAERLGAGFFLTGAVLEVGGQLQVSAALYDAEGRPRARAEAGPAPEGALFDLVDELARGLIAHAFGGPPSGIGPIAASATSSLPALKAWLRGERDFRAGQYFGAIDAFHSAVSDDPSFALAFYRLASVLAANVMVEPALQASAQALAHRERLADRARLHIEAQHAWLQGRIGEAEHRYASIVATWPEDAEAWFRLGDLLFHHNPSRGRSVAESRGPFGRALALDPGQVSAEVHLARLDALDGGVDALRERVERILAQSPGVDQALGMRALRAWTSGDKAEQADVLGALPAARALALGIAFCDVALYSGDLAGAETFGRRCLEAAHSPELRAVANLVLAHAALARGRVGAAFAAVDAAEIAAPAWAREVRGFFAALPFVPVSAATLDQIERQLLDARPAEEPPGSGLPLALHNGLHPHLHAWVRGLLAARRGKGDRLAACVEELAELAVPQGGEALLEHLVRTLEALSLRAREKPREALRALQSARSEIWFQFTVASPFYAGTFERFLRAELLADTGREEEAIAWYRSLAERSPFELIFSAPAAARQLRILDRAGRREEAERLRARLGRQLNGADVEYRRCLERGDWWG